MESELEKITSEIILRNFDLEETPSNEKLLEKIRERLTNKLDFLINHDFEKLISILYRIDVNEEKVKAALAQKSEQKPSEVLADLIIERQMEKAATRIKYRNKNGVDDYKVDK